MGSMRYPTSDFLKYAYTRSLGEEENTKLKTLYETATNLLKQAHTNISDINFITKAYENLNALWKKERSIEQQFVKTYLRTDLNYDDKIEVTELISSINEILNDKNIYNDLIDKISALDYNESAKESGGQYTGGESILYTFFNYTLPNNITKTINNFLENLKITDVFDDKGKIKPKAINGLGNKIENTIVNSINEVLEKGYKTSESNIFSELKDYLTNIQNLGNFTQKILKEYGLDENNIKKLFENKKAKRGKKFVKSDLSNAIKDSTNSKAGNIFEIFADDIFNKALHNLSKNQTDFKFSTIQTGQLNYMKADQIIIIGDIEIDTKKIQDDYLKKVEEVRKETDSKRKQNQESIRDMLKNVGLAKKDIVEISDKNYKLTGAAFGKDSKTRGFSAEKPDIKSLSVSLKQQMPNNKLDDLIFILVNSGQNNVINGYDVADALKIISLNIANFLFDDISVTEALDDYPNTQNRIHIFNLNGVLIPLSVFLEGAYIAFKNNSKELSGYISTHFSSSKIEEPNSDNGKPNNNKKAKNKNIESKNFSELTMEDWTDFYNAKLAANSVEIHFFGDFIEFIKKHAENLKF